MRIHLTAPFIAARAAWQAAYAAHDTHAEAGDDHSPAGEAASALEYETLDKLLSFPATTPAEIGEKLRIMRERNVDAGWTDYHPRYMAQIERDLLNQQRPNVSSDMAAAFAVWADERSVDNDSWTGDEDSETAHIGTLAVAFRAMIEMPCTTAGDFMLKAYAEMIDGQMDGMATIAVPEGAPALRWHELQLEESAVNSLGFRSSDDAFKVAQLRDLQDCDLGRCLLTLGRVDFDAEAWIAAARRARVPVNVLFDVEGSRSFESGEQGGLDLTEFARDRFAMTQALLAHSDERRRAVADAIEANHPDLVTRATQEVTA